MKTGETYGRLTAVAEHSGKRGATKWTFLCACGQNTVALAGNVTAGRTQSCGCFRKERSRDRELIHDHAAGGKHSRTYKAWVNMIDRCTNPASSGYARYGAAGITVCERWMVFADFLADMGVCPPALTIERIANEKGYEPSNCRWATRHEQAVNRGTTRFIEYNGVTLPISEWAKIIGVTPSTLWIRLDRWPLDRAMTEPRHDTRRPSKHLSVRGAA